MNLIFDKERLRSLNQSPVEKELIRINVFNIDQTKDPLTSFLQIVMGMDRSLVIDGRRLYEMNANYNEDTKQTTVELTNYLNLWADHKRSKFEKIAFEKNDKDFLPSKIFIYFDRRVFKLQKN